MMRYLKILFLSMFVFMAGVAFAGTTRVNHAATNTPITVSLETMGTSRDMNIVGTTPASTGSPTRNSAPITFRLEAPVAIGNLISVAFSGAAFNGATITVCSPSGTIGSATPTAGATTYNIQTSANLNAGDFFWLTGGTAADCANLTSASQSMPVRLTPTGSAKTATVQIEVLTPGGVSVDTSDPVNLAIIRSEYDVVTMSSYHRIDYDKPWFGKMIISGKLTQVTADSYAAGAANVLHIRTANDYSAVDAGLTVGAVVNLQDSANWQGVSKAYLVGGGAACNFSDNIVASNAPFPDTVSLTIPATYFNGGAFVDFNLCLEADGTTALIYRAIEARVDVSVTGTGANNPIPSATVDVQVWESNGYQATIPWLVNSSMMPTYCLITNEDDSKTADLLLSIVGSESGNVFTGSVGTLAPHTSVLATFTAGSVTVGRTQVPIPTLSADERYAATVTSTTKSSSTRMACIQTDPTTGAKRSVPVTHDHPQKQRPPRDPRDPRKASRIP